MTFTFDNSEGKYTPTGPAFHQPTRRVTITVYQPRRWWRRLLHLPAKRITHGPMPVAEWVKPSDTP